MGHPDHLNCFICRKHQGRHTIPGGAIYTDDLFYVGHMGIPEGQSQAYLGAVLVEPRRHLRELSELSVEEARQLGPLLRRVSLALEQELDAEHIYLFLLGHHVDHLHLWLIPRYPGTPQEYWGTKVDEWPEAPRGGAEKIADLCDHLRAALAVSAG